MGRSFHVLSSSPPSMSGQICIIKTTLPGDWLEAEVGAFSQQMLDAGAACVQHSAIRSVYRWEGEVTSSPEWDLQLKIAVSKLQIILTALHQYHPYDTPQIVWTIADSTDEYSEWVSRSTVE